MKETLYIKIAKNEDPNGESIWIAVKDFNIRKLERAKSVTAQFLRLKAVVPTGYHPLMMERKRPEIVSPTPEPITGEPT